MVDALSLQRTKNNFKYDATRDTYNEWRIGVDSSFLAGPAVNSRNSKKVRSVDGRSIARPATPGKSQNSAHTLLSTNHSLVVGERSLSLLTPLHSLLAFGRSGLRPSLVRGVPPRNAPRPTTCLDDLVSIFVACPQSIVL